MPVCPNCNYEYVEGATFCPDCQMSLVDNSEATAPEDWTEVNWEVLYTSSKDYEIRMMRDNLEAAGIRTTVLSQKDRNFPATGDLAIIKLMVHKDNLKEALAFIETMRDESDSGETE
jgi:hypothetical protein